MPQDIATDAALSFSPEAVHLQRRDGEDWQEIDHVRFDDADLAGGLRRIRDTLSGEAGGSAVLLVIPEDEMLYTRLPVADEGPASMPAAVARAVTGLTPYAAEDLAFDWLAAGPGEVHVAAVARRTLDEAADFAQRHGFGIRGFIAAPDPERFPGEPRFARGAEAGGAADEAEDDEAPAVDPARIAASLDRLRALSAGLAPPDADAEAARVAPAPDEDADPAAPLVPTPAPGPDDAETAPADAAPPALFITRIPPSVPYPERPAASAARRTARLGGQRRAPVAEAPPAPAADKAAPIVRHDRGAPAPAPAPAPALAATRRVFAGRHGALAAMLALLIVGMLAVALFSGAGRQHQAEPILAEAPATAPPPVDAAPAETAPAGDLSAEAAPAEVAQPSPADRVQAAADDALGEALRVAMAGTEAETDAPASATSGAQSVPSEPTPETEAAPAEAGAALAGAPTSAGPEPVTIAQADAGDTVPAAAETAPPATAAALPTEAALPDPDPAEPSLAAPALPVILPPADDPLPAGVAVQAAPPEPATAPVAGPRPPARPARLAAVTQPAPTPAPAPAQPITRAEPAATPAAPAAATAAAPASRPAPRPPAQPVASPAASTPPAAVSATPPPRAAAAQPASPPAAPAVARPGLHRSIRPPSRPMRSGAAVQRAPDAPRMAFGWTPPGSDPAAFAIAARLASLDLPPAEAGPRLAQARPARRPGVSATAVDAALQEAAAPAARPAAAASLAAPDGSRAGRPVRKPGAGATAAPAGVEAAIAAAIQSSTVPAPQPGAVPGGLRSSSLPPRRAGVAQAGAAGISIASAAPAAVPSVAQTAAAAQAAQDAAAAERRRAEEALEAQAEARIRARADADTRAEAQARAAAEARARAQAEAEERAARARGSSYRPAEIDDEPELAAAAGVTASAVAAQNATIARGLDVNRTTLIGVVGAGKASRGLIRLRNGRIVTVRLGDRIDGGTITAIGDGGVTYSVGGRPRQLKILYGR